ncbi:aldo/keto reductase [Streptomyces sp. NBRC 110611]|uniref:aldo/keto reductase n=1 Tax=Streptomyces sp. NBRC 110611 TaxID=1621259 RepID=UPI00215BF11E|nr:aldo/keto reductase [Streptomyces sp. NBRC 110611]
MTADPETADTPVDALTVGTPPVGAPAGRTGFPLGGELPVRRLGFGTGGLVGPGYDHGVPMADQLGTLRELQQEGKIRHIGLDSVSAAELTQAQELAPIASVQNRYNLLDRASEDVLKLCEQRGTAFLPWFPLGNGSLTAGGHGPQNGGEGGGAKDADADAGTVLSTLAARHGATTGQIALAWLLHHSPALLPTPGTGSPAHLDENLAAAGIALSAADLSQLDQLPGTA